jgi:hypothetical protein
MPVFYGHLQLEGDSKRLPAVVKVDMGVLSLASNQTELGQWKVYQVEIADEGGKIGLIADGEKLHLFLTEHDRFLRETAQYQKTKRKPLEKLHPAFRKKEEDEAAAQPQTPAPKKERTPIGDRIADLKADVMKEASPIVDEAKSLYAKINRGPVVWGAAALFILGVIFLPSLIFGILMTVGILAVVVGAAGYVDNNLAVRYPDPFTPTRLMIGGAALLVVAMLLLLIR